MWFLNIIVLVSLLNGWRFTFARDKHVFFWWAGFLWRLPSHSRSIYNSILRHSLSAGQRTWFGSWILLLLLEFIELGSFEATSDILLWFAMMCHNFVWEVNGVFDGHNSSKRLLLVILVLFMIVTPFQQFFIWLFILHIAILNNLTHLGIQEGVSYYHFLILNILHKLAFASEWQFIKIER